MQYVYNILHLDLHYMQIWIDELRYLDACRRGAVIHLICWLPAAVKNQKEEEACKLLYTLALYSVAQCNTIPGWCLIADVT